MNLVETAPDQVGAVMRPWGVAARFRRVARFVDVGRRGLGISDEGQVERGRVARSRLHLAPDVRVVEGGKGATELVVAADDVRVRIVAAHPVRLEPGRASREFGLVEPTVMLVQDLHREGDGLDVRGGWLLEPAA